MIAGVDAYKQRWLTVIDSAHGVQSVELIESFHDLILRDELELIVVDVPIGLMDKGHRACDVLARRQLGVRRSSVFPAPIRPMLAATDYPDACRRRYAVEEKKCSKQLFAILGLIRDVDSHITPELQRRVREGHPEVSFSFLNRAAPLKWSKRTPEGQSERVALLQRHFLGVLKELADLRYPGAISDLLDAYAMVWTARRVRDGEAISIPGRPEYDRRGLRAEIVA